MTDKRLIIRIPTRVRKKRFIAFLLTLFIILGILLRKTVLL